jgi:hypothetical protein
LRPSANSSRASWGGLKTSDLSESIISPWRQLTNSTTYSDQRLTKCGRHIEESHLRQPRRWLFCCQRRRNLLYYTWCYHWGGSPSAATLACAPAAGGDVDGGVDLLYNGGGLGRGRNCPWVPQAPQCGDSEQNKRTGSSILTAKRAC